MTEDNADLSRKGPALKAFRVAHFPKALKKNISLFGAPPATPAVGV
jgi:hypothetical protein